MKAVAAILAGLRKLLPGNGHVLREEHLRYLSGATSHADLEAREREVMRRMMR